MVLENICLVMKKFHDFTTILSQTKSEEEKAAFEELEKKTC